jgi:PleD family two-component response regulator
MIDTYSSIGCKADVSDDDVFIDTGILNVALNTHSMPSPTLPIQRLPSHQDPNMTINLPNLCYEPIRVLIVDDEFFNVEVLKTLISHNYESIELIDAFSGAVALEKLEDDIDRGNTIDVCFLDINMPMMNGF